MGAPDAKSMAALTDRAAIDERAAQRDLGVRLTKGHGGRQDYRKALKWLRSAAEHGDRFVLLTSNLFFKNECRRTRKVSVRRHVSVHVIARIK